MKKRLQSAIEALPFASHFQRIEFKIDEMDILTWLACQNFKEKIYWHNRKSKIEVAGIGCADCIHTQNPKDYAKVISDIANKLSPEFPLMRYYGGFSFDAQGHDAYWQNFGSNVFVLPVLEILRIGDEYIVAVNLKKRNQGDAERMLNQIDRIINDITPLPLEIPLMLHYSHIPEKPFWDEMISAALSEIAEKDIEKIVLARKSELQFSEKLNAFTILKNLKKLNPDSTHFCIQPDTDTQFIGGTPELLYRREKNHIFSVAIAGTRKRGKSEIEDERLEQELLDSEKDLREHRFVIENVQQTLTELCDTIEIVDPISVIKLARVQHLHSSFSGNLKPNISDIEIISKLHPTPAVGGVPTNKAISEIVRLEPFNRGWYAAPVGWISADAAHFVVAIRSGLIDGNNLHLYSGAGIVAGSDPDLEWEEIENKLANFLRAVNVNGEMSKRSAVTTSELITKSQ